MRQAALTLLVVVTTGYFSCNLITRPQALHMNNTVVAINDSLYYKGKEYGELVGKAIKEKDFSNLASCRMQFEKFIDSGRRSLINMKDVGGSEELRNCEIGLLTIEKRMIQNDFVPFEHLTPESGMDEISGLFEVVKKDSKAEQEQLAKFKKLQLEYADKNGFKLLP